MCEATTLAAASLAMTAVGTGVAVMGQMQAGSAQKAQMDYKAAVDRNNAVLASRAAADARQRGDIAATQSDIRGKQLIGRQRATLASNGGVVDQGSALDLTSDTAAQNKLDDLTIRNKAERQTLGFAAK